jgi:hypothetical protein
MMTLNDICTLLAVLTIASMLAYAAHRIGHTDFSKDSDFSRSGK